MPVPANVDVATVLPAADVITASPVSPPPGSTVVIFTTRPGCFGGGGVAIGAGASVGVGVEGGNVMVFVADRVALCVGDPTEALLDDVSEGLDEDERLVLGGRDVVVLGESDSV